MATRPKIFMGLALVHFQKYWLLNKRLLRIIKLMIFLFLNIPGNRYTFLFGSLGFGKEKLPLEDIPQSFISVGLPQSKLTPWIMKPLSSILHMISSNNFLVIATSKSVIEKCITFTFAEPKSLDVNHANNWILTNIHGLLLLWSQSADHDCLHLFEGSNYFLIFFVHFNRSFNVDFIKNNHCMTKQFFTSISSHMIDNLDWILKISEKL